MSLARSVLLRASRSPWLASQFKRRSFARRAVRRFMPGEDVESALAAAAQFATAGIGTVLTSLGERVTNPTEAIAVRDHYLEVQQTIRARRLPAHISVKLTHLGLDLDPALCAESVLNLAARADQNESYLWIDMEESNYVDKTLELYRRVREVHRNVGVCLQAYLKRTPADLESLLPLKPGIRLVKGAYREPAEIAYERKRDTDEAFLALSQRLLASEAFPVFGTHDMKLVEKIRVASNHYEIHMLYGIKSEEQRKLARSGVKVRALISYGENWFPWYVRRLAERPANVWFVVKNLF